MMPPYTVLHHRLLVQSQMNKTDIAKHIELVHSLRNGLNPDVRKKNPKVTRTTRSEQGRERKDGFQGPVLQELPVNAPLSPTKSRASIRFDALGGPKLDPDIDQRLQWRRQMM